MPREAEPSLNERAFIAEALQQNLRVDGRALDAYRPIQISFGEEYGVAEVRLGETRYDSPRNLDVSFSDLIRLVEVSPESLRP